MRRAISKPRSSTPPATHSGIDNSANDSCTEPAGRDLRFEFGDPLLQKFAMQRILRRLAQRLRSGRIDADRGLQHRRAIDCKECPLSDCLAGLPPCLERSDDLAGNFLLHRKKRIVARRRAFGFANLLGERAT